MTPTAMALLKRLRGDREFWADLAQDEAMHLASKVQAQARRDLLDNLALTLASDLAAIEAEAVEEYRGVAEWLEQGGGVA